VSGVEVAEAVQEAIVKADIVVGMPVRARKAVLQESLCPLSEVDLVAAVVLLQRPRHSNFRYHDQGLKDLIIDHHLKYLHWPPNGEADSNWRVQSRRLFDVSMRY